MKSIFSVQQTRCTAAVMLFVWLMSLAISAANACMVPQEDRPIGFFNQGQAAPDRFSTHTIHSDERTSSPDKANCLHFCVAEQSTLITDHMDGLAHLDLVPIFFLTGLLVPAADQPLSARGFTRPSWPESPVFIRYLRLTI